MKIAAFTTAVLLCFVMSAQSQLAIKPSIGMTITDFSEHPITYDINGKVGFVAGASVAMGKKFYLEPGLFFVKKSTEAVSNTGQLDDIEYNISGIRIPVTLGLNLVGDPKSTLGFRIFGGGSAFMLTSVKDLDKDDFNTASFGLYAGAGINIAMIFVDAQYEWSLTDVYKDVSQIEIGQSRTVFIHLGVRIPL